MNKKSTNKENIKEICKYYYEYWQNAKWNTKKLANLVTPELDIKKIRKLAITYATDYLNMTEDEFYTKISKEKSNQNGNYRVTDTFFKVFESISDTEDYKKVLTIIKENAEYLESNKNKLANQLNNYINVYRTTEKNLKTELTEKLQILKAEEKTEKGKPDTKTIKKAQDYILEYLESDYDKQEFCQEKNISTETFNKYLEIIKNENTPIYNIYIEKAFENNQKKEQELIQKIPEIIELLKENKNEFNLIDYYLMTNIPLTRLEEICKTEIKNSHLQQRDYIKYLNPFISKNKQIKECSERDIKIMLTNETNIVDFQTDENGNYIPGTGRELSLEEKEQLLNFLKENNIPITKRIFSLAIINYNKYLNQNKIKGVKK